MSLLPASWVESLFARLTIRYGAAFMRQYADLNIDAVKADWSDVLGGFATQPQALAAGLGRLPADRPINAMQFRDLCREAMRDDRQAAPPALNAPLADSKMVHDLVASVVRPPPKDFRQWARDLQEREETGEKLTLAQRELWRKALKAEAEA